MPYLIDGHNLIPKIGLRLDSVDDEERLIDLLQEYCRIRQIRIEVFFDGAPHGQPVTKKMGRLTAHFVRKESSADAAIEIRLDRLGKSARNWTVVSSDRRVQRSAGAVHANHMTSEAFSREILRVKMETPTADNKEATLAPNEVEEWLEIFNQKKD
jgi:predicted RNA-binding protein with PIN domain